MTVRILLLLITFVLVMPAWAGQEKVVLASLEWPPYTGEKMALDGATGEVVRQAFRAVGYELEIRYYPWKRAIQQARENPEIVGYFPEYPSRERHREFLYSNAVGVSPLGLAERSPGNSPWYVLADLQQYVVGVVAGYANTEGFDALVRNGVIQTDEVGSDVSILRKLLHGRVDMGVIDANVFEFLVHTDPMLETGRDELVFNSRLLALSTLHVCFRADADGERFLKLLNEGLEGMNVRETQATYIKQAVEGRAPR